MEIGLGHLGLTPEVFWDMTPFEFSCALKGYEQRNKLEWERVRWQTWHLLNIQLERKHKLKYDELILPHEAAERESVELTEEQKKKIFERFDKPVKEIKPVRELKP